MKAIAVIPARYGSTRLPGKPLAMIKGKPMVQRVYEQCRKAMSIDKVIVATDDRRIMKCVEDFGGNAVMTSRKHQSGTDRVIEAVKDVHCRIVVNVQGDEPYIDPAGIDKLVRAFDKDSKILVGTLAVRFAAGDDCNDVNKVKVVTDLKGDALYFSRSLIPSETGGKFRHMKHLGIYAFRKRFLEIFQQLRKTELEKAERLEQLRILANGYKIRVIETSRDSIAVDTAEDLEALNNQ